MKSFALAAPATLDEAVRLLESDPSAAALAGGQDLLTELKAGIAGPSLLVSLASIGGLSEVKVEDGGLAIGALVTISGLAEHDEVRKRFPVLAQAAQAVATPQIRNLGTVGGNLCQRPRCWYYRAEDLHCLKKGGATCYAQDGENRYHAVLANKPCAIVHPSDLAPALLALGARVRVAGPRGRRELPLGELYVLPDQRMDREVVLQRSELIEQVLVPAWKGEARSAYVKIRERDSFDFALASAAVVLALRGGKVEKAGVALGGVAPVPWRAVEAEQALAGQALAGQAQWDEVAARAGKAALAKATPLAQNAYKVILGASAVHRAIMQAAGFAEAER